MATKTEPVPQEVQDYFDRKFLGKTRTFTDPLYDPYLLFHTPELRDLAGLPDSCKGPSQYQTAHNEFTKYFMSGKGWPVGSDYFKPKETMFTKLKNLFKREPKQSVESRLEMLEAQLRDYTNRYALCDARIKALQNSVETYRKICSCESKNFYKVIYTHCLPQYLKDGWEYIENASGDSAVECSLVRKPLITKKSTEKPVKKQKKR